ncbi:MAG: hypothetical protein Q9169_006823 [Polycauliona sp. 2 TL-2023]
MACRVPVTDVPGAIHCLQNDGGVILTGFATQVEVATVNDDAAPYLEALAEERVSNGQPKGTLRCHRLFGRSRTARENWMQRPEVHRILSSFLKTKSVPYNDQGDCVIETDPILSSAATMQISPGEKAQDLHRDDFIWQRTHDKVRESYENGSDMSLGFIVAGSETTRANGEAFAFLGSTVHGGGTNLTAQSRTVHGFFFCRSWMRPEENQFLWWAKEEIETWSISAQKQAGYLLGNPFLGHCDETDPMKKFRSSVCSERELTSPVAK